MKRMQGIGRIMVSGLVFAATLLPAWSQTAWKTAANGVWSDPANWTNGVPNANNAALGLGSGSYTVTVDAVANAYLGLTVTNAASNTTTLDINATGFRNSAGKVTIGRRAIVNVNSGGEWRYEGTNALDLPFVTIKDGGEVLISGGSMVLTNRQVGGSGVATSSLNIGDGTTGRLAISSGLLMITTNDGTKMTVGANGGYGTLDISGGTVDVRQLGGVWNASDISIAGNTGSRGEVNITGGALTAAVNVVLYIAFGTSSSGRLYAAGSGNVYVGSRNYFGTGSGAQGYLTVDGNANVAFNDGSFVGGLNGGTGTVNVLSGKLRTSNVQCGNSAGAGGPATGTFNLFGGWADLAGQATRFGYGDQTGIGIGTANLTNGLLTTSYGGAAPTMAVGNSLRSGTGVGVMNISGSTVWTNTPPLIVGFRSDYTGSASGTVNQTGGRVVCLAYSYGDAMGFGGRGGWGQYLMSGGSFVSKQAIHVGGSGLLASTNTSWGLLKVTGGSFVVSNTLYVGAAGTGTVTVGSAGVLRCSDLVLSNNTSSTLRFEVATDGTVGQLVVTNMLTIASGSKLEVYVPKSFIDMPTLTLTLATCRTNVGSFADVAVSNYPLATVLQTTTNIQVLITRRPRGSMFIVR